MPRDSAASHATAAMCGGEQQRAAARTAMAASMLHAMLLHWRRRPMSDQHPLSRYGSRSSTHGHDAVREVKRLLHAIPMMDVDVHIQHSVVLLQQLQDGEHDVVDVAEAGSFRALCVVHAAGPVEREVALTCHQVESAVTAAAAVELHVHMPHSARLPAMHTLQTMCRAQSMTHM